MIDAQVPSWLGWTEPLTNAAPGLMNRRALFAGLGTIVLLVAIGLGVLLLTGGGDDDDPRASERTPASAAAEQATGDLNTCAGLVQDEGRACYSRELAKIVNDAADPLAAVEGITAAAYADQTGFLLANCHGIMHTVAREYALRTHLTLAKLMDNLPQTNDPGCSAGYAHGLVTAVAPEIEREGPKVAIKLCASSETRYQRYSCTHGFGHAFMRLNNDKIAPALQMCGQLGSGRRARLRPGRLPRLLVRGERDRRHHQAQGRRHRAARAVRRAARRVRAPVLVPRVRGDRVGHAHRVRGRRREACAAASRACSARRASPARS